MRPATLTRAVGRQVDRIPRWILSLVIAPLLALVALSSWALSSPVGSSPDDDFHLASIWCGAGDRPGICEPGTTADSRRIPQDVRRAACYAYRPEQSAGCQRKGFGTPNGQMVQTRRGNFSGLYPPLFYLTMSAFVGPNVDVSVVAMRITNAVLLVLLVTATWALLPRRRRPALLWSVLLTAIPLSIFIIPSTNPSSWAVISAGVLWISVLGYLETSGRRRIALGGIAVIATVMAGEARADAAVYSILGVALGVWLGFRKGRGAILHLVLPAVLIALSVLFYRLASQGGSALGGLSGSRPPGADFWVKLFFLNVGDVPDLWVGVFGRWKLGWLDTELPASVWVIGFGVVAGAIALHFSTRTRRVGWAMLAVLGVLIVLPCYILTQSGAHVGGYVQPRYLLPMIVVFVGLAIIDARGLPGTAIVAPSPALRALLSRGVYVVTVLGLTVANCLALRSDIRRYVTGQDADGWNLSANAEWWWPAAPTPMVVWIVGTASFAALLVIVAAPGLRQARRAAAGSDFVRPALPSE